MAAYVVLPCEAVVAATVHALIVAWTGAKQLLMFRTPRTVVRVGEGSCLLIEGCNLVGSSRRPTVLFIIRTFIVPFEVTRFGEFGLLIG